MLASDAIGQGVPCAVYALDVRIGRERRRRARALGVPIREYGVFHELLADVLHSAGLPGPARELDQMRASGAGGA